MANHDRGEYKKPKLAVFKFASCDGCQLSLLDAKDDLLEIAGAVEIVHFLEVSSHVAPGPYDITLVEGSITTPDDVERIQKIRAESKFLMTIGACATAGGIQALRNWGEIDEYVRTVYAQPEYIRTLARSTPIAEHVRVDFELRGCPINKQQLVEVLSSLIAGRQPRTPGHCVCLDCKRRGTVCVTMALGTPCVGPITQSGCGAICPAYDRGCYGCFGPAQQPNPSSLADHFLSRGVAPVQLVQLVRNFNAWAPDFREAGDRIEAMSQPPVEGEP